MAGRTKFAKSDTNLKHGKLLVAAIDFGTTCTGYAYSLTQDFKKDPLNIGTKQSWEGSSDTSLQAPTSILFAPDKTFHSFGFEAETKYKDLAFVTQHKDWYFFKHFKMILHHVKNLSRETVLEAANGKHMKACDVFTEAIKAVADHIHETIQTEHGVEVTRSDIWWVLTVPAIWSDSAKMFMRYAAEMAGIKGENLSLALEPEVASVYCKEQAIRREVRDGVTVLRSFDPGERYMVLDLGGGTVDVTIHEVCTDGKLKEVYAASGGPWGGTSVNEAFSKSIKDTVGEGLFSQCLLEDQHGLIIFENAFEDEKKKFHPGETETHKLHLPDFFTITKTPNLAEIFEKKHGNKLVVKGNYLLIHPSKMEEYFDVAIDKITDHISSLLQKKELGEIATIMLVGGFAESRVVLKKITNSFKKKTVFVPPEAGVSVLKGSVIFGHNPDIIAERISPWTYGVHTRKAFNKKIHDSKRKQIRGGKEYVSNAFAKYLEIGESVTVGKSSLSYIYIVINPKDRLVFWKVYKSKKENPVYCDEKGVDLCGTLEVELPEAAKDKKWRLELNMTCIGTELVASVNDAETKTQFKSIKLDFLVSECGSGSDFMMESPP